MQKVDTIIFDLDGVITNSFEDVADAVNVALTTLGLKEKTYTEIRNIFGRGIIHLMSCSLGEDNIHLLERAMQIFRKHYNANCLNKTHLYPTVKEVLNHFNHKNLAVLTNKPEDSAHIILQKLHVHHFFSYIYGPASLTNLKPHPEGIQKLMTNYGSDGDNTVMVGDSAVDIEAGKAARVVTCAVTKGFGDTEELLSANPDFSIDSLDELIGIFN